MFALAVAGVRPLVLPDLSGLVAFAIVVVVVAIVVSLILVGRAGSVR